MKADSLHDLAALTHELQRAAREREARAVQEREQAARERRERELFALTIGPIAPLRRTAAPVLPRPRPLPIPRQLLRDEAAARVDSLSDEFDVESLLDTDDSLSFHRRDVGPEVVRKLRRGVWALQAQLDLHGMRRAEARESLTAFLHQAVRNGLRCVRVIHGKGNGSPGREPVLKAKVKTWLVQKSEVLAFTQARATQGGHGALIVLLRPHGGSRTSRNGAPGRE